MKRKRFTGGRSIVARHRRSYVRGDVVYDPLHYPSLLEKKPGALDQATPLRGWKLDPAFGTLRRLLEAASARAASGTRPHWPPCISPPWTGHGVRGRGPGRQPVV